MHEGEIFGFLGPNGAGKTTMIRTVLGLLRPSAGSVRVFGHDAWADAPTIHTRISYVGSDPGYLGGLTAGHQLDVLARLRGLPPGVWHTLAERFELDPAVPIRKLSRGNRQKVGVVQAFMGDAPLLILDEPTSGLDPLMQREFLAVLGETRAAGRTVFLSSHNLPEVEHSCDRVGIIRDGRLVEISTVQALLAGHWRSVTVVVDGAVPDGAWDLPDVRLVSATGPGVHLMIRGDLNPLLRRLASLDVRDLSITTPEIEDVFLGYYGPTGEAGTTGASNGSSSTGAGTGQDAPS